MMNYLIAVANGDWMTERKVIEVNSIEVRDDVYIFYDKDGTILFSSPIDSTVSVELAQNFVIVRYERGFGEMWVEKLNAKMERTGDFTWIDGTEDYHKLKDVEWINRTQQTSVSAVKLIEIRIEYQKNLPIPAFCCFLCSKDTIDPVL